jgi:predicted ferric reductase
VRLNGRAAVVVMAIVGLVIVYATDQVAPASSDRQAQLRIWLAARATGITTFLLLTAQVAFGLILSHPTNRSTWKLSKRLFPWHDNLLVFVVAFVAAHIVTLAADPYAGVGLAGALVPGLSSYRSSAVALGTLGLYALLVTGLSARYTSLLPRGLWLRLHRLSIVVFVLAWVHGVLAGTDSVALLPMYVAAGLLVVGAGAYRYWVSREARPTFATSLPDRRPARPGPADGPGAIRAPAAPNPPRGGGLRDAPVPASPTFVTTMRTEDRIG